MKRVLSLIVLIILIAFVMTFHLRNPQDVSLAYYFGLQWEAPLALVLSATFVIGLLMGGLAMSLTVLKSKRVVGKTKRQLAKAEKEVENLRAMPIKDELSV